MKTTFTTALDLFDQLCKLAQKGISPCKDTTGTYEKFNELFSSHDFSNMIYKNAKEHYGIQWCTEEVMVPANYDKIKYFTLSPFPKEDCLVIARRDGKDLLINYRGEEIFEADELQPSASDITPASFRIGDKWGLINRHGKEMLPPVYDLIQSDVNEFTWLYRDGKQGFIAAGHLVKPKFDSISFEGDSETLVVTLDGKTGYIDGNDEFTENADDACYSLQMFL